MITLNQVLTSDHFGGRYDESIKLQVNGEPVWDFKEQNGELRLIHEPLGVKEEVVLKEIYQNYGMEAFDLPVVSETETGEVTEVEVLSYKDGSEALNFKTK
jgi:hypothetical protein